MATRSVDIVAVNLLYCILAQNKCLFCAFICDKNAILILLITFAVHSIIFFVSILFIHLFTPLQGPNPSKTFIWELMGGLDWILATVQPPTSSEGHFAKHMRVTISFKNAKFDTKANTE